MITEILKETILSNIGHLHQSSKGWMTRNCMLCHTQGHGRDTRGRFGVQFSPTTIVVHCFNCSFSAVYTEGTELSKNFKFFLKQINVSEKLIKEIDFEIFKQRTKISYIRDGDEENTADKESKIRSLINKWQPIELPPDSMPVSVWLENGLDDPEFQRVVNYARSRNLTDFNKFYWSPYTANSINQRLLLPYYYRGQIYGYTGRLYYEHPKKIIPKYYQNCPEDFVYNLDNQSSWARQHVILTEGVFDAFVVDGVASLGEIGQEKVDIINRLQKNIIVCPDRDRKGWDLVEIAIENNWSVSFPRWERGIKDAAEAASKYGRLLTTYSIVKSAVRGKNNIILKWKLSDYDR